MLDLGGMHVKIDTTKRLKKNVSINRGGAIAFRSPTTSALTAKMNLFVMAATASSPLAFAQSANSDIHPDSSLQEIVVTAEKRNSTIQDTPISLTAITGDQLQAQGISDMKGVIAEVPGISMRTSGPGQTELEMRMPSLVWWLISDGRLLFGRYSVDGASLHADRQGGHRPCPI